MARATRWRRGEERTNSPRGGASWAASTYTHLACTYVHPREPTPTSFYGSTAVAEERWAEEAR
eukprot:107956-Pyramimonas_sp.AAC.1